jgi:cytochrome b involved in lipid metabolism
VYDVTNYLEKHPGGIAKIMDYAGKDATVAFQQAGHSIDAIKQK